MSKQSFTPGPWTAGGPQWSRSRRTPETQKRAITSPNHPVIANAYGEANARLIAAAPELLKELEHLASLLHPWIEAGNTVPGIATLNGAWSAIDKARGES